MDGRIRGAKGALELVNESALFVVVETFLTIFSKLGAIPYEYNAKRKKLIFTKTKWRVRSWITILFCESVFVLGLLLRVAIELFSSEKTLEIHQIIIHVFCFLSSTVSVVFQICLTVQHRNFSLLFSQTRYLDLEYQRIYGAKTKWKVGHLHNTSKWIFVSRLTEYTIWTSFLACGVYAIFPFMDTNGNEPLHNFLLYLNKELGQSFPALFFNFLFLLCHCIVFMGSTGFVYTIFSNFLFFCNRWMSTLLSQSKGISTTEKKWGQIVSSQMMLTHMRMLQLITKNCNQAGNVVAPVGNLIAILSCVFCNYATLKMMDEIGMPAFLFFPFVSFCGMASLMAVLPLQAKLTRMSEQVLRICYIYGSRNVKKDVRATAPLRFQIASFFYVKKLTILQYASIMSYYTITLLLSIPENGE